MFLPVNSAFLVLFFVASWVTLSHAAECDGAAAYFRSTLCAVSKRGPIEACSLASIQLVLQARKTS